MSGGDKIRIGRRSLLKAGAAIGALPFIHAGTAGAETAVGNFPAGVAGDTAFVGVTIPLTGPYSADGNDLLKGYQLAIEQLNGGGGVVGKLPNLTGKGVLGKKIVYKYADTQTQPNPAVQAQTGFITRDKAIMIAGSLSSAVAIALEKLAQREKVLNMVGCSGANETTGADCVRYAFRNQPSAYMADLALAPTLGKHLGRNLKAAYLVPDYVYGHSVFDTLSAIMDKHYGWKVATQQVAPLGTTNFSSYLLNIGNSGAEVFVNITFGADAVSSTKQAAQFGLISKMKQVQPNVSSFLPDGIGAELMQDTYGTMDFWWTEEEHDPMAKIFVTDFQKKFNYRPRWGAHIGYTQMMFWAEAVERAKSFDPVQVIKMLESGFKLDLPGGETWYRSFDHQAVRAVPVVLGKKPSEMKSKDDYFEILELVPGEQVMPPQGFQGCKLGPYT
jgi:branched-chain amino acid transport system substrate-binding protein